MSPNPGLVAAHYTNSQGDTLTAHGENLCPDKDHRRINIYTNLGPIVSAYCQ